MFYVQTIHRNQYPFVSWHTAQFPIRALDIKAGTSLDITGPQGTHSPVFFGSTARLRSSILIAQLEILLIQPFSLLLQILQITLLLLQLLL